MGYSLDVSGFAVWNQCSGQEDRLWGQEAWVSPVASFMTWRKKFLFPLCLSFLTSNDVYVIEIVELSEDFMHTFVSLPGLSYSKNEATEFQFWSVNLG